MDNFCLTGGKLITPQGIISAPLHIADGKIVGIGAAAARKATTLKVDGFVAPGFIDLHVWGDPRLVAEDAVAHGTTAFLTTLGPAPQKQLIRHVQERADRLMAEGAACLGIHLEGPYVSPNRAGALPKRWMRPAQISELEALVKASQGRIKLVTLAPNLAQANQAIRWLAQRKIIVSLGHSEADAATAKEAVKAGASGVTHIFNGMKPFHHRSPSLVDVALLDDRLTAMVIADGIHTSPEALKLLFRVKPVARIALVTDSIRRQGWDVVLRRGAYYRKNGTLAGSRINMMEAVRNAVEFGGASLADAVCMASEVPARLLGMERLRGSLSVGKQADLVVFDKGYQVQLTLVAGKIVYEHN